MSQKNIGRIHRHHTTYMLRVLAIALLVTLFVLAGCGGGGSNGGNGDGDNGEKPVSFAPADPQAFNNRVAGKRLRASVRHYIDFLFDNRFIYSTDGQTKRRGRYAYSKTGLRTGELAMDFYVDRTSCTVQLTFT